MTTAASLLSLLRDHARYDGRIVLGLSGGLDSSLLLAALVRAELGARVLALHVHHGIQPEADHWARHCRTLAARYGVAFHLERVSVPAGGNLEARARAARHAAFRRHLLPGDRLWLAHHRDDQAETLLLRLLRGAGARGLAAMPAQAERDGVLIVRPLLTLARARLEALAREWGLDWVEDPSNRSARFDRNFLRHEVLPLLQRRWPGAPARLAATAARLGEDARLLDELAWLDLDRCGGDGRRIDLPPLRSLPPHRQRNLLRGWLRRRGMLPPDAPVLQRVLDEILPARADAEPRVEWPDGIFARHRDHLWLLRPEAWRPWTGQACWVPGQTASLDLGAVRIAPATEDGPADLVLPAGRGAFELKPKAGGERLLLRGHHRRVKEAWRSAGLPPWRRRQLPLFWHGDELVAVPGIGVADPWRPAADEPVLRLRLRFRD